MANTNSPNLKYVEDDLIDKNSPDINTEFKKIYR